MSTPSDPQPPARSDAPVSATPSETSYLDANGFDPAAYEWVPVLRRPRKDGWTPKRQQEFIAALAATGCVEQAAREVGMSVMSCYRLRDAPGAESFARAWDAVLARAARRLVDIAFDRAIHGTDEPVFDKIGNRVGRRMRQNDRLLMFLLRAYMPERFRHAHRDDRAAREALPAEPPPVPQLLEQIVPVAPAEPEKLMTPDELDVAVEVADLLEGKLPSWHHGKGDAEPIYEPPPNPKFERDLENAKRANAGLPPLSEDDQEKGDEDETDDAF